MRRRLVCIAVLVLIALSTAETQATSVAEIVDQVTLPEYLSYMRVLTGIDSVTPTKPFQYLENRYSLGDDIHVAAQWIQGKFDSFGLDTTLDTFDPNYGPNVIGELRGRTRPDDIYIIGAHYDTYHAGDQLHAPGCDDNASGTGAVLIAGSVLSQYEFDATIRFVAFSGEEQWMVGSLAYAAAAQAAGENIRGMINYDMFLHPSFDNVDPDPDYDLDIAYEDNSQLLAQVLATQFSLHTSIDVEFHNDPNDVSDQWSFWQYGYSAAGIFENTVNEIWGGSNDAYHQLTDTMGNPDYDWDFAIEAVRGGTASLASLAGLYVIPEPASIALVGTLMSGLLIVLRRHRSKV